MQLHSYSGLQLIPNFRRFTGGLFVLERLLLDNALGLGNLEFVAGARADGLVQTAFLTDSAFATQVRRGRLSNSDCTLSNDVARCDKNLPATSITAGARWHLPALNVPDALDVQLDLSSASRFPDVDELYLGGRAPSLPVFGLGDAGLGTERTWQASLGAELRLPDLVIDGGAFVSRINDYIAFGPELTADGTPIVDVLITGSYPRFSSQAVEAMLSGFDGGVVVAPGALFSLSGQVAVVRGLDLTHSSFLPFIPPNQARVELRTNLPDVQGWRLTGLTAATSALMVARQDRTDARSDFAPPADAYALWNAEAHTTVDVGQPLTVGVEVKNILNQRYRDQLSLLRFFADQPGREVWVRASLHFDQAL
jgi:iron complex outermembrane receptor protein